MIQMTENELFAALREAVQVSADVSGYASRQELQEALGWGADATKARLRQLHKQGRLLVAFRQVPDITGRLNKIPTYKVTKGKK